MDFSVVEGKLFWYLYTFMARFSSIHHFSHFRHHEIIFVQKGHWFVFPLNGDFELLYSILLIRSRFAIYGWSHICIISCVLFFRFVNLRLFLYQFRYIEIDYGSLAFEILIFDSGWRTGALQQPKFLNLRQIFFISLSWRYPRL